MASYIKPNNTLEADDDDRSHQQKQLPDDFAMWDFMAMELSVFTLLFIGFAIAQRLNVEMFALVVPH
jgi:nitric oxide reductase NorE protein